MSGLPQQEQTTSSILSARHDVKRSAGLLLYKFESDRLVVLLVHPGGPFWVNRDQGSWTIPKGGYGADEDALAAAIREFGEETGAVVEGPFHSLGEIRQRNRKTVSAWAAEGDFDPAELRSNLCEIEWPPRSGRLLQIPEVDRAEWFSIEEARSKINLSQLPLLERLKASLAAASD
jgi:predicted NUDIX family NTP pyrophosphohydrolase